MLFPAIFMLLIAVITSSEFVSTNEKKISLEKFDDGRS